MVPFLLDSSLRLVTMKLSGTGPERNLSRGSHPNTSLVATTVAVVFRPDRLAAN